MKRTQIALALLVPCLFAAQPSAAGDVGLGIRVGEPTGFSGKFWTSTNNAVDVAASWSLHHNEDFQVNGDFVHHDYGVFDVDDGALGVYYGVGGRMLLRDRGDDRMGLRVPVGLSYFFPSRSVELFAEVAPTVDVVPDTDGEIQGVLGVHFTIR
jgi:hypothetical protein